MLFKSFLYSFVLFSLFSCQKKETYLGGIQVNEPDHQIWAEALKRNKMNTVSVTVYAKQGDWDSDNFWHDGLNEGVLNEIRTAKKNNLKVILILRTALDHAYKKNKFLWHGMVLPKDEETLTNWFTKYTNYISFWSEIAEKEHVDILGIGSELKALSATHILSQKDFLKQYTDFCTWQEKQKNLILSHEDQISKEHLWVRGYDNFNSLSDFLKQKSKANQRWAEQVFDTTNNSCYSNYLSRTKSLQNHWRKLIKKCKQDYSGKLTYAANFDNYNNVAFWNELDFIGINAYFKLRRNITEKPNENELRRLTTHSWDSIFNSIVEFKDENNIATPLLFTELGYTFRQNSTVEPWAHDEFSVIEWKDTSQLVIWYEQSKNYQERNIAINSLIEINHKYNDLLEGILYWKLSTDLTHEKYEEFLLHIGKGSNDPLLKTLNKFQN